MEKRMLPLKGSKTEENLKAAFAGESEANRRYLYFAQKADIEGYNDVSAVFRSLNVDFPHTMLRYRAVERRQGRIPLPQRELVRTDRNGRLAGTIAPLANWGSDWTNALTRPLVEKVAGIHRNAALPKYHRRTFEMRSKRSAP
jgi:Rubrerythrin